MHEAAPETAERPIVLYVSSPHIVLTAALRALLDQPEFHLTTRPSEAEVAVVDLCSDPYPYADPIPGVQTLAIVHRQEEDLPLLLRKGYRGYLRSTDALDTLLRAIHMVHSGEVWAERKVLEAVLKHDDSELTLREQQVYRLLGEGLSNREIAERLNVTVSTVKAHITAILGKRRVKSRLELLARDITRE
jgi:DNA-binding CsgD family transcriptional regulator